MKSFLTLLFYFIAIITQRQLLLAQAYRSSIDIRVTFGPEPVIIEGKSTVYYEVHVTSFSSDSIILKRLEIVAESDSSVIKVIGEADLSKRFATVPGNGDNLLLPGSSGVIYIECVLPSFKSGLGLFHRFDCESIHFGEKQRFKVHGAGVLIPEKQMLVLGSPLKEGPWAAIYDPSWERGHRRVFYTINGTARIPGRFAIDFIKLNARGEYAKGDDDVITNWLGYDDDVLAVSDGIVATTRNDFNESTTLKKHPAYTAEKASGNYISIDIGNGHLVFYEHLRPGSIKVKTGQHVKKGDTIASLGFTGQTTGPHLHLHVADKNSPLGAEGVPFAFESFILLGAYNDLEKFGSEPWRSQKNSATIKSDERPSPNSVIKFRP